MAKVTGLHQSPRAPSMRRAVTFSPGPSGMVARAWPINGKRKLSPKQQEAVEAFREAALIAKYAPAADQMRSRELAHGSQFLPRDLQYMAIFGRLCTLYFSNGERRYQMASRYDLTELLDILGFKPGSFLYRGPDFWEVIEPGNAGEVLTTQGDLLPPVWAPGGAGGGGAFSGFCGSVGGGVGSLDNATWGQIIEPQQSIEVSGMGLCFTGTARSYDYTLRIARVDSQASGRELLDVFEFGTIPSGKVFAYANARAYREEPLTLIGGLQYVLLATLERGTGANYAADIAITAATAGQFLNAGPIVTHRRAVSYGTRAPAPGMTYDDTDQRYVNIWCEGSLAPED